MSDRLWPRLTPQRKALFRSQGGPPQACHTPASRSLHTAGSTLNLSGCCSSVVSGSPLLPTARNCRCGLPLDSCGHHRAACAGAVARICREAGARVSLDVRVQDMDLAHPDALDNRRLEIVAGGLSLFQGAQLDDVAKNGLSRSSRASSVAPVWLSLQAKSRAGGQRKAVISSVSWRKRGENPANCGPEHAKLGGTGGRRSWLAVLRKLLPCRSWNTEEVQEWMVSLRQPQP